MIGFTSPPLGERTIKLSKNSRVLIAEKVKPHFIGQEIGNGICAVRTSLKEIKKRTLNKIEKRIKQIVTFNYEVEIHEGDDDYIWITLQDKVLLPISDEEYRNCRLNNINLIMGIFKKITNCEFIDYEGEPIIDCPINSIEIENDLVIHRKNAIQAKIEQLGIIQGELTKHIVRGYGYSQTHKSCPYKFEDDNQEINKMVAFCVELMPLVSIKV